MAMQWCASFRTHFNRPSLSHSLRSLKRYDRLHHHFLHFLGPVRHFCEDKNFRIATTVQPLNEKIVTALSKCPKSPVMFSGYYKPDPHSTACPKPGIRRMEKPSLELVLQALDTLYRKDDPSEKEKASQWLMQLQASVSSTSVLISAHQLSHTTLCNSYNGHLRIRQ